MTARQKREPRQITVADIEQQFELASFWLGETWCPAVYETARGYAIRVVRSQALTLSSRAVSYDQFDVLPDGTVDTAPRGYAKDWKPGRVTDIEAAVERYATPPADAMRISLGGEL